MWNWWNTFWAVVEEALQGDAKAPYNQPLPIKQPSMTTTKASLLYNAAKNDLGQHLTLNNAVPWMVGCAEAVSKLLHDFGTTGIPIKGFEGTALLCDFLTHSAQFNEIYTYTPGAILIAVTGSGNGKIRGHVGVCGNNAIMSNNSETGKWDTQWDIARWLAYYGDYGGITTRYFLPV